MIVITMEDLPQWTEYIKVCMAEFLLVYFID